MQTWVSGTAQTASSPSIWSCGAAAQVASSPGLRTSSPSDTPEMAVPILEQSERDFPDDYIPPERLAFAFMEMND